MARAASPAAGLPEGSGTTLSGVPGGSGEPEEAGGGDGPQERPEGGGTLVFLRRERLFRGWGLYLEGPAASRAEQDRSLLHHLLDPLRMKLRARSQAEGEKTPGLSIPA